MQRPCGVSQQEQNEGGHINKARPVFCGKVGTAVGGNHPLTSKKSVRCICCKKNQIKRKGELCKTCLIMLGLVVVGAISIPVIARYSTNIGDAVSAMASSVAPKGKIKGAAWVTKGSGQSDIQRGLEVVLCPPILPESVATAMHLYKNDYFSLTDSIDAIDSAIAPLVKYSAKADVDGKYVLPDVVPGKYHLYARIKTNLAAAYWLVPLEIASGQELSLDLDNTNMRAVENIPPRFR